MADTVQGPQLYGDPNVLGPGEYKKLGDDPQSESVRLAVFGYNPKTGKAYTPKEIEAANAGYNPYGNIVGYDFDPKSGQLTVLSENGTAMGLGARTMQSPKGNIVYDMAANNAARIAAGQQPYGEEVQYDEFGVPIEYSKTGIPVSSGKGISTGGGVVTGGARTTGGAVSAGGTAGAGLGAFVSGAGMTSTGQIQNPYIPGTEAFTAFQQRESAYNLLYQQMAAYGLQTLVEPLKNLVLEGVSPSEFTIRLRDTAAYKQRFGANQARINKGLRALSEAEYIGLEDQYQNIMRQYGLPSSYYTRTDLGRQEGFEKFIAGDVSPAELESRISTAYDRVINANPEVSIALKTFYPNITNGDILSYALNPDQALNEINRKITAAEIGGAAVQAGLTTNESDAEYLARYGITKAQAQQGYRTISGYLPRASFLSDIYGKQGVSPYTQASAEREVFGTPGAAEEERKRQRITALEQASFSGQAGLTGGALSRERAGQF